MDGDTTNHHDQAAADPRRGSGGTASANASAGASANTNACLACRKIKMRCIVPAAGQSQCQRCARKSLDCVFLQHRRGRKPGTKIKPRGKGSAPAIKPESQARTATSYHDASTLQSEAQSASSSRGQSIHESADWETGALQPSGLLQHAVSHGQFSLRNILNAVEAAPVQPGTTYAESSSTAMIPPDDPVKLGLVTLSVATELFQSFLKHQNPFINQLDPGIHTLTYVRQRSPFLASAVLAVAAKGADAVLHERLVDHAEDLLTTSFRQGLKSTEIAQAVMVLTYWKKPEDNRAWISLGYAVRMGMELGWHRLHKHSPGDIARMRSDKERLEARNIQRTWYILFVYDRSMSLQTGKPWMIERSDFIESIEAWCKDPLATHGDRLLGAFVTLRLLSSEVFKLLGPRSTNSDMSQFHRLDSFLAIIKGRIDDWELKWTKCVASDSCHPFLIAFYGAHLRLQLFSLPLQAILCRRDASIEYNLEALWTSYSSAVEMLRLICRHPTHARLAQDSVHVMTAYCAKFLIKLLMSAPSTITNEVESEALITIDNAARALRESPPSPAQASCTLQSTFLARLTTNYLEKQASKRQHNKQAKPGNNVASRAGSGASAENHDHSLSQDMTLSHNLTPKSTDGGVPLGHAPSTITSQHTVDTVASNALNQQQFPAGSGGLFVEHNFAGLDVIFADDMTWSNVFPDSMFAGQNGVMSM